MSASFVNADTTTVRVPLLVIEDLIKAGKFTEADSAFGEWRRSGDSAPRVAELEQTLASTRAAASSLALAQTKAEISTTRASTPNSSYPDGLGALLLPERDETDLLATENQALEKAAELFSKGFVAEQAEDYALAARRYQEVLTIFPNSQDAQRRLVAVQGKILAQSSTDVATSPENSRILIRIAPLFDKGVTRFNAGDYAGARSAFQEVLILVPNHPAAKEYVRQCANLEKATAAVSTVTAAAPNAAETALVSGLGEVFADPESFDSDFDIEPVRTEVLWEDRDSPFSHPLPDDWNETADPWTGGNRIEDALVEISVENADTALPYESQSFGYSFTDRSFQVVQTEPSTDQEADWAPAQAPPSGDIHLPDTDEAKVEELIRVGMEANRRGDILTASEMWEKALQIDPDNQAAAAFLEKYANERADARYRNEETQRQSEVDEKVERVLDERTFALEQRTPVNINEILGTMAAIADLQIITGEGVDGDIHALRTTELTYREFLDRVLSVNGYSWSRDPGTNLITVTRDLVHRRFPLSDEQYQSLKGLAMNALGGEVTDDFSEALRTVILGEVDDRDIDAFVPGRVFHLNKFMRELVVRDSRYNVELVEEFLSLYAEGELEAGEPPLLVETFRLPVSGGDDMARIINLRLFNEAEFNNDFTDQDPYLVYDPESGVLIIRQTPAKLELVKRLMQDPQFVQTVLDRELKARKFIVVPAEDRRLNTPDAVLRRKKQTGFTEKVFRSLLYGTQSIEEAAAEGRVMYPDPDEGTIDIVDTPENLRKIDEYLLGVTETSTGLQRIVPILHRSPNDLLTSMQGMVLATIPSTSFGGAAGTAGGGGLGAGGLGGGGLGGGGGIGGGIGGIGGGLGGIGGGLGGGIGGGIGGGLGGAGGGLGGIGLLGILPVILKGDTISNTITVLGFQVQTVDQAEDLIKRLDIPPLQVEVEVRLVELRYDATDAIGVSMNINNILALDDGSSGGPGLTTSGGSLIFNSQPNTSPGSTLSLATLGRTRIAAVLTLLSQFTDVRILTAPKITVVSGTPGNIDLIERFPFVSAVESPDTGTTVTGSVIGSVGARVETAEEEIGFTLDVTPSVTGDGHVDMQLAPVISTRGESLVLFDPTTGEPLQGQPIINERTATVRVRVDDGGTLVIGGLLRRELDHTEGRTPPWGFIPGLAPLFTDKEDGEFTQNLLILVSARVIREE